MSTPEQWMVDAAKAYAKEVAPLGSDSGDWERIVATLPAIIQKHHQSAPAQAACGDGDGLAYREAKRLAEHIWKAHYRDVAPNWSVCDSTAGIISQIDNMYAGLRDQSSAQSTRVRALEEALTAALAINKAVQAWTSPVAIMKALDEQKGKLEAALTAAPDARSEVDEKADQVQREYLAEEGKGGS